MTAKEQMLSFIKMYEKEKGTYPSQKLISKKLGIRPQTVGTYLRKFQKEGLIGNYERKRYEKKDLRLMSGIFAEDIERTRRFYQPGRKIRVIRSDGLGDIRKENYKVIRQFPNLILIQSEEVERAREQGAPEEIIKKLERICTTTITNAQLVAYVRNGKKGIAL